MSSFHQYLITPNQAPLPVKQGYALWHCFFSLIESQPNHLWVGKIDFSKSSLLLEGPSNFDEGKWLTNFQQCNICLLESIFENTELRTCPFKIPAHDIPQPCVFKSWQWLLSQVNISEIKVPEPASRVCYAGLDGLRAEYLEESNVPTMLPRLVFQQAGPTALFNLLSKDLIDEIESDLKYYREWVVNRSG